MHNIGGRWVIYKQRNHGEHRFRSLLKSGDSNRAPDVPCARNASCAEAKIRCAENVGVMTCAKMQNEPEKSFCFSDKLDEPNKSTVLRHSIR